MSLFEQNRRWIKRHMPKTEAALARLPQLDGVRLACSMHLDEKMMVLVEGLLEKGAAVFLTTCNPTTVRDDVVRYLQTRGADAQAWHNMPPAAYQAAVAAALAWRPTHLCEMGAELTTYVQKHPPAAEDIQAGLEATGSGINRLAGLQPAYPIFNWDDLPVKEGLHNRHMVGLTAWHAFTQQTRLTLHGKRVLIVGFGLVGRGAADAARAFGGSVVVAERDPARALEAAYAGWPVASLETAIADADVILTATGATQVIGVAEFSQMKEGAFLLNVGHHDAEIDVPALRTYPHERVLPHVEAFDVAGREIFLFAGGSMANLTAGHGDSLNAFDVTLAVMTAGLNHIFTLGADAPATVHMLPRTAWIDWV